MAQLFVLSGSDVGRSFEVEGGATIGRSPECAVVLKDRSISRHHAHLEERDGIWSVIDDGARNGVSIGGVRVPSATLDDGQELALGEVLLRFRTSVDAPPPPPPAPDRLEPAAAPPPPQRPTEAEATVEDTGFDLEEADEIDLAAGQSAAPAAADPAAGEGLAEQRGRVLQYHRVPDTGSVLSFELAQLPAWKRWGIYFLALALLAGVAWLAFFGAAFLKGRLAGDGPTGEPPAQLPAGG